MPSPDIYHLSLHDALPISNWRWTWRSCLVFSRSSQFLDAAAFFMLDDVQAAFFFDGAGPAAATIVCVVGDRPGARPAANARVTDRKSTRLNSSHRCISYAVSRHLPSFPTRRSSDLQLAVDLAVVPRLFKEFAVSRCRCLLHAR